MTLFRRITIAALVAPLSLALAACGSSDKAEGAASGEPIAHIPAPAGSNWTQTASVSDLGGNVQGNPNAPLKLVEYASFTCSHCADFATESQTGLEEYVATGVVSYEIRNQIHDGLDLTIAMLVRCGDPATFHPLANQAWTNFTQIITTAQSNGDALNAAMASQEPTRFQQIAQAAGLVDFFAARGISRDQAMQCLADPAKAEKIANDSQKQSEELGVTGTPTFFLTGRKLEGTAWKVIEPQLQQAGAR